MVIANEDNFTIKAWAGLNMADDIEIIADEELAECSNYFLGANGQLIKTDGRTTVGLPASQTGPYHILGQFIRTDGTIFTLIYCGGTKKVFHTINAINGVTPTWTEETIFAGVTVHSGIQLADAFYISASTGVYKWTGAGTGALLSGSPLNVDGLIAYQTQLFGFVGSELRYTSISNPDIWTSPGGWVSVNAGDGDNITAIISIGDRIMVFKSRSCWMVYLSDDPNFWQVRGVHPEIGCVGKYAIRNIRGIIYFLFSYSLWATDGISFNRLSSKVENSSSPYWGQNVATQGPFVNQYGEDQILFGSLTRVYAYRFLNPRGFTMVSSIFNGPFEKMLTSLGAAPTFVQVFGTVLYWATPGSGPIGSTAIVASLKTKAFLVEDRVSRFTRNKYTTIGTRAPNSILPKPSYYYLVDDQQTPIYYFPARQRQATESAKILGAGYGRSIQFCMDENSQYKYEVYYLNLICMVKRQQIEADV